MGGPKGFHKVQKLFRIRARKEEVEPRELFEGEDYEVQRAIDEIGEEQLGDEEVLDLVSMSCQRRFCRHFELKCFE